MKVLWETERDTEQIIAELLEEFPKLWEHSFHRFGYLLFSKPPKTEPRRKPTILSIHARRKGCAVVLHQETGWLVFTFVALSVFLLLMLQFAAESFVFLIVMVCLLQIFIVYGFWRDRRITKALDRITGTKGIMRRKISWRELDRD